MPVIQLLQNGLQMKGTIWRWDDQNLSQMYKYANNASPAYLELDGIEIVQAYFMQVRNEIETAVFRPKKKGRSGMCRLRRNSS